MNKKTVAASLISLALVLTSCTSANKDNTPERVEGGQTKVTVQQRGDDKAAEKTSSAGFHITFNGVDIVLDEETTPVVKAIGGSPVYTEKPSCAYVGIDYTYDYKAFVIYAQSKNGKELINTIEVRTDEVDAGGAKVGQTLDDVKKVYGTPTEDEETVITYVRNGTKLQFITDESGKVVLIILAHETAE